MLVDYISYYILIFFLLLPVISLIVTFLFLRGSVVEMSVASVSAKGQARQGDRVNLELRVRNPSLIPVRTRIDLSIRNDLTGDEERETVIVPADKRGGDVDQSVSFELPGEATFRIDGTGAYDFLGIFCFKTKRTNQGSASLIVFPDVIPIAGIRRESQTMRDVENDGLMQVVKGDDPSELYDIRAYRPGDRVSRIHWKMSHKSGNLMVKEFGRVVCGDMLVMLDLNGRKEEVGALLRALTSVSAYLSQIGASYDVEWYSGSDSRVGRDHVASEKDEEAVVSSILREGRLQAEPFVLRGRRRIAGRSPYSKVIYLCSWMGISRGDLQSLAEDAPGSEVQVLLIADDENIDDLAAAAFNRGTGPRILRVRPSDVAIVLEESML
jgi:uncharacterized protein (DUF58 family)